MTNTLHQKNETEEASLTQMKRRARVELDKLVSRRAGRKGRSKDAQEFAESWLTTGMAKKEENGHIHATCLNSTRSAPSRGGNNLGARRIYVDGSMNPRKRNAKAGYGIAEYEVTASEEKFLSARYGKVITSPRHKMFQGATKHTNNAGELTALLRAIYGELEGQGHVTFVSDSMHAINTATGGLSLAPLTYKGSWVKDS